jgi:DNA-binding IscR family transcriptional regulator
VECVSNEKYCNKSGNCVARQIWAEVQRAVRNVLQATTLKDVIEKAKDNKSDYQI